MTSSSSLFDFHRSKFTCGEYIIDPSLNSLNRNGKKRRIEPKHLSLLCYMASRANEVISRKELAENVWPSTIVVEEVITHSIFALRNALGDDAKNPRYIETISRKGYRLIAQTSPYMEPLDSKKADEVIDNTVTTDTAITKEDTTVESGVDETVADQITGDHKPTLELKLFDIKGFSLKHFNLKQWIALALIGVFALAVLVFTFRSTNQSETDAPIRIKNIRPVTYLPGEEKSMSIHFASQKMAYVYSDLHASPYTQNIFISDLAKQARVRLTNNFWLPRSLKWINEDSLAYIRCRRKRISGCQIVTHHIGGNPKVVFSPNRMTILDLEMGKKQQPTLFVSKMNYDEYVLNALDLSTGRSSDLLFKYPELPSKVRLPKYSQDARYLFMLQYIQDKPSIAYLDLKSEKLRTLPQKFDKIWDYALTENKQIFVAGTYDGARGLWLVDQDNIIPRLINRVDSDSYLAEVILAPSEKALYVKRYRHNMDINLISHNSGSVDSLSNLNSSFTDVNPIFSDNGESIYFFSNRSGNYEIWHYSLSEKSLKQITNLQIIAPRRILVSDNERLIAASYRTSSNELAVIERDTGKVLSSTSVPFSYQPLSWSRDGNSIYVGDRDNNRHLLKFDKKSLKSEVILPGVNRYARESSDGKSILFLNVNKKIEQLFFESGQVVERYSIPKPREVSGQYYRTRIHENFLYLTYIDRADDTNLMKQFNLNNIDPSSSTGDTIYVSLDARHVIRDISPDGNSILTTYGIPEGEIFKVELQ